MPNKRMVYYIPETGFVEGHGYRVSIVKEGESGHFPSGHWPYHGRAGEQMPWFWGTDLKAAQTLAQQQNEKMGISEEEAWKIVNESIGLGLKERKGQPIDRSAINRQKRGRRS